MIFVGIDPGVHGAVAVLNGVRFFGVWDAPLDENNAYGLGRYDLQKAKKILENFRDHLQGTEVLMEAVHAFPQGGAHSGFLQGEGVMLWKAMCVALEVPITQIVPQTWRREFFKPTEKEKRKHESLVMARKLFPQAEGFLKRECDDGRAEALLIAEFCRRTHYGKLEGRGK